MHFLFPVRGRFSKSVARRGRLRFVVVGFRRDYLNPANVDFEGTAWRWFPYSQIPILLIFSIY
jgi:hypothetical protein